MTFKAWFLNEEEIFWQKITILLHFKEKNLRHFPSHSTYFSTHRHVQKCKRNSVALCKGERTTWEKEEIHFLFIFLLRFLPSSLAPSFLCLFPMPTYYSR